jgi:hypothetical protein
LAVPMLVERIQPAREPFEHAAGARRESVGSATLRVSAGTRARRPRRRFPA